MTNNNRIKCPLCESQNCFEESIDETKSYLCVQCGYMSTSLYIPGSDTLKKAFETTTRLIQDLQYYDLERNLVWVPSVVNVPNKGMVVPEGDVGNWWWSYIPIIEIEESEKEQYPVPDKLGSFYEFRLVVDQKEMFHSSNGFMLAMEKMGMEIDRKVLL